MTQQVFVERRFALGDGEIVARFYTPTHEPGGEYKCRFTLAWPEREERYYACGIDSMQALMLAMRHAHTTLADSDAYRAGQLTYLDQKDLDLPPPFGDQT